MTTAIQTKKRPAPRGTGKNEKTLLEQFNVRDSRWLAQDRSLPEGVVNHAFDLSHLAVNLHFTSPPSAQAGPESSSSAAPCFMAGDGAAEPLNSCGDVSTTANKNRSDNDRKPLRFLREKVLLYLGVPAGQAEVKSA